MSVQKQNPALSEEQIRTRAYEIYAGRGYQDGNEESDWLQAERELREQLGMESESISLGERQLQPQLQSVTGSSTSRRPERMSRNRESLHRN